jgi:hypothetical protein
MLISLIILLVGLVLVGMIHSRPRMRKVVRYAGLALVLTLFLLWVSSMRYAFGYVGATGGVYFESGGFAVFATHGEIPATGWMGVGRSRWPVFWWFACPAMVPLTPVWMPLLAAAFPTALTLARRRPLPGHCQECGYDLTGNVSGVCPECGKPIQSMTRTKTMPSEDHNRENGLAPGEHA